MLEKIFKWFVDVIVYTIPLLFIPIGALLLSDVIDLFSQSFFPLMDSIGLWAYASFLVIGIFIKIAKDQFKNEPSEARNSIRENSIIIFIVICGLVGIAFLNRFFSTNDQKMIYVYACPIDNSNICYEVPADEPTCQHEPPDGGCEEWTTTLYPPKEDSIDLLCYPGKGYKLNCLGEESGSEKEWEVYVTDEKVE